MRIKGSVCKKSFLTKERAVFTYAVIFPLIFSASEQKCQENAEDNAEQDGSGNGNIKNKIFLLYEDITREFTNVREFPAQIENKAKENYNKSNENEVLSEVFKWSPHNRRNPTSLKIR